MVAKKTPIVQKTHNKFHAHGKGLTVWMQEQKWYHRGFLNIIRIKLKTLIFILHDKNSHVAHIIGTIKRI